jgi:hypothetical protein
VITRKLRCILWIAVSTKRQAAADKISLEEQERLAREYAESQGFEVVAVLRVPGHSRRYLNFDELISDAARKGIIAFQTLKQCFEEKNFDWFICYDATRFGRTQTLIAFIVETIITDVKAKIYSLRDGVVDEKITDCLLHLQDTKLLGK